MTNPELTVSDAEKQRQLPKWQLKIRPDGTLAAENAGLNPPLTVTGDTLASLRKQTRNLNPQQGQH
jgi:hypothetical protein